MDGIAPCSGKFDYNIARNLLEVITAFITLSNPNNLASIFILILSFCSISSSLFSFPNI